MKTKLKLLQIGVLILLVMVSVFAFSCNNTEEPGGTNGNDSADPASPAAVDAPEEPEEKANPLDLLPSEDYGGYEFKVLVRYDAGRWDNVDFRAEEDTGEPLNDAVFYRNKAIEDKFNVNIVNIDEAESNMLEKARSSILAGDNAYDLIMPLMGKAGVLANEGYLYDLFNLPNLDLEAPCWDQNSVSDLSINRKLYMVAGDLMTLHHEATNVCIFNKNMIATLALENPYKLVREDKWTFDKLQEMITGVTTDLNGDGAFDRNDRFGLLSESTAATALYNAAGELLATKDGNDLPVLGIGSERSVSVIMRMTEFLTNTATTIISDTMKTTGGGTPDNVWTESSRMFFEGKILFRTTSLRPVRDLREWGMEEDYGIIPLPKYDEFQERYYHSVQTLYNSSGVTVPMNAENPERTGLLIQAICAASTDTVRRAYYDINLINKITRDEESAEMLDIIFASRLYDIGYLYNWENFSSVLTGVATNPSLQIVSQYDRIKNAVERTMQKMIDKFLELDN